jgi:N utilization substance protein B
MLSGRRGPARKPFFDRRIPVGKRRKGREIVLQSLYASLIGGGDVLAVLEDQLTCRESAPETITFARDLARKIKTNRADTERWLKTLISARWDPSRLGTLELCILHLGLTELKHSPEVPFRAIINEACELARRFCEEGAVGFVNGVLDRAAHQVYPEASGTHAGAADAAAAAGAAGAADAAANAANTSLSSAASAGDPGDDADDASDDGADHEADLDADFGDTPLRGSLEEVIVDPADEHASDPGKERR